MKTLYTFCILLVSSASYAGEHHPHWYINCNFVPGAISSEERFISIEVRNIDPERPQLLDLYKNRPKFKLEVMNISYGASFSLKDIVNDEKGGAFVPANYSKIIVGPNETKVFKYKLTEFSSGLGEDRLDESLILGFSNRHRLRVLFEHHFGGKTPPEFYFSNTIFYPALSNKIETSTTQ